MTPVRFAQLNFTRKAGRSDDFARPKRESGIFHAPEPLGAGVGSLRSKEERRIYIWTLPNSHRMYFW